MIHRTTVQQSLTLCEQSLSLSLSFLTLHDRWGRSPLTSEQFMSLLDRTTRSKLRLQGLQARLDACS